MALPSDPSVMIGALLVGLAVCTPLVHGSRVFLSGGNRAKLPGADVVLPEETTLGLASAAKGLCVRDTKGHQIGCTGSCHCGWSQRCYPRLLTNDRNAKSHDGKSLGIDVGVCGSDMLPFMFMSAVLFAMFFGCLLALRACVPPRRSGQENSEAKDVALTVSISPLLPEHGNAGSSLNAKRDHFHGNGA
mmetsp:Transcript_76365/g.247293  ORF Transcript_76365/g.247293 Transcript_76365/m.247293 type:complete len:189 (-) Transcript_76365:314-880(-)